MSETTGTVKYVKKARPKRILLLILVAFALFAVTKLIPVLGRFTGEVAEDGMMYNRSAEAWSGPSGEAMLSAAGVEVALPATEELAFSSDDTAQTLNLGNPAGNQYDMNFALRVSDHEIYNSGILKAGEGIAAADLGTYFKPNTYDAVITYTFYRLDERKVRVVDKIEKPVRLNVTGSEAHFEGKDI